MKEDIELLLSILHDLKRDHNHNFHDMAVKTAISGYDEFLAEYEYLKNNDDLSQLENDVEFDDESTEEFANEEEEEEEDEEVHEPVSPGNITNEYNENLIMIIIFTNFFSFFYFFLLFMVFLLHWMMINLEMI